MIAPETGFPTGGSCLMRAEIPIGWHTGKHFHGEEAIYVESGEGFMILDDKRYDFFPGTIFHIPYRAPISSSIPANARLATFPVCLAPGS